MDRTITTEDVLNLGTWLGRKQALGLIAGRCAAGEIECLIAVYENKMYLAVDATWEDYCKNRLGISRNTAERLMRNYQKLGPNLMKLGCFARIRPSEYRMFAGALTDDGLLYNGEPIPLEPENAPQLAQAVEAIRKESAPEPEPADPAARSFARAEKSLKSAVEELHRLQAMQLDDDGRLKLVLAVEAARNQLDLIHMTTKL